MSSREDGHGNGPDEDEVRDLLARLGDSLAEGADGSGEPQSIPAEVDDRIVAALAELPPLAPKPGAEPEVVVPLERSRRRVGGWLVAAALVVAVGGGGWALAHRSGPGASTSMASAGGSADDSGATALAQDGRRALPSVSLASFDQDVTALLGADFGRASGKMLDNLGTESSTAGKKRSPMPNGTEGDLKGYSADSPEFAPSRPDCTRPAGVTGRQVEVSIDGRLGQLIVSPSQGKRVVTAYDCAGHRQLATTTLPQ